MVMRFVEGFLTVGRIRGVPVRVHWATPIGALLVGRFQFRPVEWALFAVLVLLHELAHAAAAQAFRLEVWSADLVPWGGQCVHERPRSDAALAVIAAAGPAMNFALAFVALVALDAGHGVLPARVRDLVDTFALANVFVGAVNLIPVPPLDGARAWKLPGIAITSAWNGVASALERASLARARRRRARHVAHLRSLEAGDEDDPSATRH
jgi:Zn-dependent protease